MIGSGPHDCISFADIVRAMRDSSESLSGWRIVRLRRAVRSGSVCTIASAVWISSL